MNFEDLYVMNPWWRSKNEIFNDRHISLCEKSSFKYHPEKLFKEIDLSKLFIKVCEQKLFDYVFIYSSKFFCPKMTGFLLKKRFSAGTFLPYSFVGKKDTSKFFK